MADAHSTAPVRFRMPPAIPTAGGGSSNLGAGQPLGGLGIFPPWIYPAANATPIFQSDTAALVGANTLALPAGLHFQVPAGRVGVIKTIQLFVDSPSPATVIRWQLLVGGIPVPGLGNLTVIGRAAASISQTFDNLAVIVPELQPVDVQITDVDGGSYVAGAQYTGWHWDKYNR